MDLASIISLIISILSLCISYRVYTRDNSALIIKYSIKPSVGALFYPDMVNDNSKYELRCKIINNGYRAELIQEVLVESKDRRTAHRINHKDLASELIIKEKEAHELPPKELSVLELKNAYRIMVVDYKGNKHFSRPIETPWS